MADLSGLTVTVRKKWYYWPCALYLALMVRLGKMTVSESANVKVNKLMHFKVSPLRSSEPIEGEGSVWS